jgi:RNA recognition motif-containing protein
MGGKAEELAALFEPFGRVADQYIMTNKDVGFVHMDTRYVENAMLALEGAPFNGGKMKIEYGKGSEILRFCICKNNVLIVLMF